VHIDIETTVRGDSLAQCASALMNNEGLMMHLSRENYVFDTAIFLVISAWWKLPPDYASSFEKDRQDS
jgi:hypothetical protein